ncbi:hypothetical protein Avbf_02221 [Armadillidium vulgare]|nr:hypothetical protein Avbf_02221 [Armadillidium vulgare]
MYYIISLIFIISIVFYVFQYYYVGENLKIWTKFTDLKEKQNWTHSFNNYTNPKPIQYVLKNKKREYNCSDPFITISDKGRLGNNICEFIALYLFKIEFGVRAVVSSRMYETLTRIFETVPLPHLPNPCFNTKTKSRYTSSFSDIYRKFKNSFTEDENTMNFTNIDHYTFIDPYPCPEEYFMSYRQKFRTLLKLKHKNIKLAKNILENALKTRKFDKDKISSYWYPCKKI